jgi:hypothetical protein
VAPAAQIFRMGPRRRGDAEVVGRRYCMQLVMNKWILPHIDTSAWEFFALDCKNRDATGDKVLHDAVEAGQRIGAIFKEPTVTPSALQARHAPPRPPPPLALQPRPPPPLALQPRPPRAPRGAEAWGAAGKGDGAVQGAAVAERGDAARVERHHHLARHHPHRGPQTR